MKYTAAAAVVLLIHAVLSPAGAASQYGVCSHLLGSKFPYEKSFALMKRAGVGQVRFDFSWARLEHPEGTWHFERLDGIIAEAERQGVQVLPILDYGNSFANPVWKHLDKWSNYVHTVVARYKGRFPVVEVWNEENGGSFWASNRKEFGKLMQVSYRAAKAADPAVKVALGGLIGTGAAYVEGLYEDGFGDCFDIVCNHPYTWPDGPERMTEGYESLRGVLERFGDGDKRVWCTEVGFPSHEIEVQAPLLGESLAIARPERKTWRTVYAALPDYGDDALLAAKGIARLLPAGSTCRVAEPGELASVLAAGDVDAVVLPFGETYFLDDFPAVVDFVRKGGTLVHYGGFPFYIPMERGPSGGYRPVPERHGGSAARKALRLHVTAPWSGKGLPQGNVKMKPCVKTAAKAPKGGWQAGRWLSDKWLAKGDEFIPVVAGATNGTTFTGMAVYRFAGGRQGAAIISTMPSKMPRQTTERRQAALTARAAAMCFANGVDALFFYELRSTGVDRFWSEANFGLVNSNGTPKAAYDALAQFIRARPSGSVMRSDLQWRDSAKALFYPQWTTPGKVPAGMLWKAAGKGEVREFAFEGKPSFRDMTGNEPSAGAVRATGDGRFRIEVSQEPLYFSGAVLKNCRTDYDGKYLTYDGKRVASVATGLEVDGAESVAREVRLTDEGFAVRYRIKAKGRWRVRRERTEFRFPADAVFWGIRETEDTYPKTPVPAAEMKGRWMMPLTVALPDGRSASVMEAYALRYPRAKAASHQGAVSFAPLGAAEGEGDAFTPWRVVQLGATAAELVEHSGLVPALNPPPSGWKTDWIRPGITVSNEGNCPIETAKLMAVADQASRMGAKHLQIDWGWYGTEWTWSEKERKLFAEKSPELVRRHPDWKANTVADPRRAAKGFVPYNPGWKFGTTVDLDIPALVGHLKKKNMGLSLYLNDRVLKAEGDRLDELFALYAQWGVSGLKPGFVEYGTAEATQRLRELARLAAKHKLWLCIHDAHVPDGFERTWPNVMLTEGGGGEEGNHPPRHELVQLFARCLCGPFDYTPQLFRPGRTHRHYAAMLLAYPGKTAVVRGETARQFGGGADAFGKELEFVKALPFVYDETRVLAAEIGRHIVIARRRGRTWFLAALSGDEEVALDIPADFLEAGRTWTFDEHPGKRPAKRGDVLQIRLAPADGYIATLRPVIPEP